MIRIAFSQTNRLFILLDRAEKERRFSMANGMFKIKMGIDRHGPRRMPGNCKNLNPPYFSLPSTFKKVTRIKLFFYVKLTLGQSTPQKLCNMVYGIYIVIESMPLIKLTTMLVSMSYLSYGTINVFTAISDVRHVMRNSRA